MWACKCADVSAGGMGGCMWTGLLADGLACGQACATVFWGNGGGRACEKADGWSCVRADLRADVRMGGQEGELVDGWA